MGKSAILFKLCLLFVGLGVSIAAKHKLSNNWNTKIERLQKQSMLLSAENPQNTKLCFDYYKPIMSNITEQYDVSYSRCIDDYSERCSIIENNWSWYFKQLEAQGQKSCDSVMDCNNIVNYVEAFECFAHQAAENSKQMYEISVNAGEVKTQIWYEYNEAETNEKNCINRAERTYVQNTADAYESLNDCLETGRFTAPIGINR